MERDGFRGDPIRKNTITKNTISKSTIRKNTLKKNTIRKNTIRNNRACRYYPTAVNNPLMRRLPYQVRLPHQGGRVAAP